VTGSFELEQDPTRTAKKFTSSPRVYDHGQFSGIQIGTDGLGQTKLSQIAYIEAMLALPLDTTFETFASRRSQVAWACPTRPDLCCAVSKAAQVTIPQFEIFSVKALNSAIKQAQSHPSSILTYPRLDIATLHLRVYADASYASNTDLSLQVGYYATSGGGVPKGGQSGVPLAGCFCSKVEGRSR
jgi:hypothetical protein